MVAIVAYIRVIDEDEASGLLFDTYDEIQRSRGRVSNVLRVQSLDPKGLKVHLEMYNTLVYGKGPLSRRERELIAVVVSAKNACEYCLIHHSEALNKYVKDDKWVKGLANDPEKFALEGREANLRAYALGLTTAPGENRKAAVQALRKAGFDDEAILQATEITSYFNFVNRLATGLGADLEAEGDRDYNY